MKKPIRCQTSSVPLYTDEEEKDGVKVVAGDSVSESTVGGFHLLEVLQLSIVFIDHALKLKFLLCHYNCQVSPLVR